MAAPGWERWFDTTEADRAGRVITPCAARPAAELKEGDAVLDVGAGYGEPGLSAAAAVGPTGHVTCLDISGDMLAFAERRARQAESATSTSSRPTSRAIRSEPSAFDAVLSRAALDVRDRPAGDLAPPPRGAAPQRAASRSPSGPPPIELPSRCPSAVMIEMGVIDPPPPGPGPFALGADGVLAELVRSAGFEDVRSGTAVAIFEMPSPEACTQWLRDVAPPITELVANHPTDVQEKVWARVTDAWAPFQDDSGAVRLPCTAIWVGARVPA